MALVSDDEFNSGPINEVEEESKGHAKLFPSSFNMANCAIGAGVLAFPYAFLQTGLALGLIIATIQTFICACTLEWIGKESQRNPPEVARSYEKMIQMRLGTILGLIASLSILGTVLGAMVGYIIIIGDMLIPILTQWFDTSIWTGRGFITLLVTLFVIFPISSLKTIDSLKFTSVIALLSISFAVCLVISTSIQAQVNGEAETHGPIEYFNFSWQIFQAIPVITFALTCHTQAPPIYQELVDHNTNRFRVVIAVTYGICLFLYLGNGVFGYAYFRDDTLDNILNNYPSDFIWANAARLCVVITVTFSYPLMNFSFRSAFDFLAFDFAYRAIFRRGKEVADVPPEKDVTTPKHWRYVAETFVAAILCWIVSVLIPSISVVFGLIGALSGSFIVFILPGLIQFQANKHILNRVYTGFVVILGIIIAIIGTLVIVVDFIEFGAPES